MVVTEAQKRATLKWRDNHREQYNDYMRSWRERNPDKVRENQRRSYANKTRFWRMFWAEKELE